MLKNGVYRLPDGRGSEMLPAFTTTYRAATVRESVQTSFFNKLRVSLCPGDFDYGVDFLGITIKIRI